MNKLWVFGDSMTYGHGCRPDGPLNEYYYNYKKEGDDIWPNIVANNFNLKCVNMAIGGCSNDIIIDEVIKNFDKINVNDIVIIGKSFSQRYDIPKPKSNKWFTVIGHTNSEYIEMIIKLYGKKIFELLINFCYHFSQNEKYKIRQNNRIEFLGKLFKSKNIKCIIWGIEENKIDLDRIIYATNGKIKDYHFSFYGHKQFADKIINKLNNKLL